MKKIITLLWVVLFCGAYNIELCAFQPHQPLTTQAYLARKAISVGLTAGSVGSLMLANSCAFEELTPHTGAVVPALLRLGVSFGVGQVCDLLSVKWALESRERHMPFYMAINQLCTLGLALRNSMLGCYTHMIIGQVLPILLRVGLFAQSARLATGQ